MGTDVKEGGLSIFGVENRGRIAGTSAKRPGESYGVEEEEEVSMGSPFPGDKRPPVVESCPALHL